ncbi:hypothetical protein AQUCO_05800122v1 [Aquilegia coerulea]|uniref:GDT1 family protein n=1 Tax=Aquilegia coerulea TaxID=218851 RepID=A0A2G5CEZ5_AQUCA|nr:hypothetical protein AQUCO_05800122v1 [Aquilegia coerulea]
MDSCKCSGSGGFFVYTLFVLILLVSAVSAQEVEVETSNGLSDRSSIDLGRRSKIVVDLNENDSLNEKNELDSVLKDTGAIDLTDTVGLGVLDAFFASLSMILVSEIGDETFIIAALMAMRHPKSIVLSGALTALIVMTRYPFRGNLQNTCSLWSKLPYLHLKHGCTARWTAIYFLYAFFGLRLLYIAWRSKDSKASQKKEMEEVEEKLETQQGKTAYRRFFSRFCTPIFLEAFILTFLAEWGDRSQIATIAVS